MGHAILLYGATGYSGRLIAREMKVAGDEHGDRMVLAGRDATAVGRLAEELGMEGRAFSLEDQDGVVRGLTDFDVVINAAGPFAFTALRLARGALAADCHYVDINGEVDVYKKLDDLGRSAALRKRALVCAAGHSAAASNLMLRAALGELRDHGARYGFAAGSELAAIRIAQSRVMNLSRGSMETLWRSLREQVTVVRMGEMKEGEPKGPVLWHEPVGKLERIVAFGERINPARGPDEDKKKEPRHRLATAANLVDTLAARHTVATEKCSVSRIESYVEIGTLTRIGYQLGSLLAPVATIPVVRDLTRLQLGALPDGPTEHERKRDTHTVVLEIEDPFETRVIHWRWNTPNPYDFTARIAVEIARKIAESGKVGWVTPAQVLVPGKGDLTATDGYLQGCTLHDESPSRAPTASASPVGTGNTLGVHR